MGQSPSPHRISIHHYNYTSIGFYLFRLGPQPGSPGPSGHSGNPSTPAAHISSLCTHLSQGYKSVTAFRGKAQDHQQMYDNFHLSYSPHKTGDLVPVDDLAQQNNELAS